MKYIIACLLGLGFITGVKAQDKPDNSNSFSCYYVDEKTFMCNMNEAQGVDQDGKSDVGNTLNRRDKVNTRAQEKKEGSSGTLQGRGLANQAGRKKKQRYQEPEKESDTGVLGEDGLYGQMAKEEVRADERTQRKVNEDLRREENSLSPSSRDSIDRSK